MTRYKDLVAEGEGKEVKRISIDLPIDLVAGVDRLRKEWGFRARGLVFERLLEVILSNDLDDEIIENRQLDIMILWRKGKARKLREYQLICRLI